MKRILLACSALFLLGIVNVSAQEEEDVTSYIANSGFDEDITWNADGSVPKEIISNTDMISYRSYKYLAADSSIYAMANTDVLTNGEWKAADGRTWATNGFVARISGWELVSSASGEWVYFGSLPYSLGENAVPVADNGTAYLAAPATKPADDDGDDNVAALYLRAGWGAQAIYRQTINLPCAQYRLDYWVYNANYANSSSNTGVTNLCKVTCRRDEFLDEDGFNAQEWTKHSIEFTPTTDFTIQFGFKSSGGSNSNPFIFIDGIKLYKIGEADEAELVESDIYYYQEILYGLAANDTVAIFDGVVEQIDSVASAGDDAASSRDLDEMTQSVKDMQAYIAKIQGYLDTYGSYTVYMATIENLLKTTHYAGYDALEAVQNSAADVVAVAGADELADFINSLQDAISTYNRSQEASEDNPADYTFLMQSPYFTTEAAKPTIEYADNNAAVLSVTYPNVADYTTGSAPSDANSTGWSIGTSGGDQRLNYAQGRVCWNAWRTGSFTVTVQQSLTDLPNGYYTVSAEMITQADYVTDQHVFATATTGTSVSPSLTSGQWNDDAAGAWDYLTTEKVLVSDGTLTVGAAGSQSSETTGTQAGWFCVTNFRLLYYGEASADALKAIYDQKLTEANTLVESVYYKADKAAYSDSIAAYSNATTADEYNAALKALNSVIALANASISKYNDVTAGSLNDLKTNIESGYSTNQKAIAQNVVNNMEALEAADDATYTEMDSLTTILRYYRDTYLPKLAEVESATVTDATAKAAVEATVAKQVAALSTASELLTTDVLATYVAELERALNIAAAQDALISGNTDLTGLITNPSVDASSNSAVPEGWTVNRTNGDKNTTTGQAYNGESSNRYFDSWNATAGTVLFTAYQVIENIPNGVYELKAKQRASGTVGQEGVYLFAMDEAFSETAATGVFAPAHVQATDSFYVDNTMTKGTAVGYFTDSYGPIWTEAYDAVDLTGGTEEQNAIVAANGGIGRGWFYNSLQITVTNNVLTIGVTCDSTLTAGHTDTEGNLCVPFSGNWFSTDDWELTIIQNNQPDYNLATGIETIRQNNATLVGADAIYSVDGRRVSTLDNVPAGIYVVRQNGKTYKVLKK